MNGHGPEDAYGSYGPYDDRPVSGRQVALIDLLDRLLSGGVVLTGDLVLSIADIDLVRISLRAVIVSVREQMDEQWALIPPGRALTEGDGDRDGPG
ncbi:gas vesicle protein [Streptomyces sp. B93]|uniref:gas vesicle protein n=1 Tax=Streptomyces sp. B93 TaxID=2824875 RepID=UPI001B39B01F|nr:gas vesicle protein [Streptomyces sp. B93]MBQ1090701.1 gas vesicle protein [Streptomyces sp. B93]